MWSVTGATLSTPSASASRRPAAGVARTPATRRTLAGSLRLRPSASLLDTRPARSPSFPVHSPLPLTKPPSAGLIDAVQALQVRNRGLTAALEASTEASSRGAERLERLGERCAAAEAAAVRERERAERTAALLEAKAAELEAQAAHAAGARAELRAAEDAATARATAFADLEGQVASYQGMLASQEVRVWVGCWRRMRRQGGALSRLGLGRWQCVPTRSGGSGPHARKRTPALGREACRTLTSPATHGSPRRQSSSAPWPP